MPRKKVMQSHLVAPDGWPVEKYATAFLNEARKLDMKSALIISKKLHFLESRKASILRLSQTFKSIPAIDLALKNLDMIECKIHAMVF